MAGIEVEQSTEHLQVLPGAQDLVDRRTLTGQPDPTANLLWVFAHVEAGDAGATAIQTDEG